MTTIAVALGALAVLLGSTTCVLLAVVIRQGQRITRLGIRCQRLQRQHDDAAFDLIVRLNHDFEAST